MQQRALAICAPAFIVLLVVSVPTWCIAASAASLGLPGVDAARLSFRIRHAERG